MGDDSSGLVESDDGHTVYPCVFQELDIGLKICFGLNIFARRVVRYRQSDSYAVFKQTIVQGPGESQPIGIVKVDNSDIRYACFGHQIGHLYGLEGV